MAAARRPPSEPAPWGDELPPGLDVGPVDDSAGVSPLDPWEDEQLAFADVELSRTGGPAPPPAVGRSPQAALSAGVLPPRPSSHPNTATRDDVRRAASALKVLGVVVGLYGVISTFSFAWEVWDAASANSRTDLGFLYYFIGTVLGGLITSAVALVVMFLLASVAVLIADIHREQTARR